MTTARAAAWCYALTLVTAAGLSVSTGFARWGVIALVGAAAAHAWLTFRTAAADRQTEVVLVVGAAVATVVWLFGAPAFSDDVYRYLLDGQTSSLLVNPYAYAPDSPKVADWIVRLPGAVNHPELPTIYPAVSQALFALNAFAGGGLLTWRLICVAAVALAGVGVRRLLPTVGTLPAWLALVSHPLVVISAASHGHIDAFAPLMMVGALLATRAGRARAAGVWAGVRAGAWVGIAVGLKLFPGLLIGGVGADASDRRWRMWLAAAFTASLVVVAAYAPFLGVGPKVLGSSAEYARSWEYNAGPYAVARSAVDASLERLGVAPDVEVTALTSLAERRGDVRYFNGNPTYAVWMSRTRIAGVLARLAGVAAWFAALFWVWRTRAPFAAASALLLWVFYASSPVVHPWYLLWLVVPAMVARDRIAMTWSLSVLLALWAPAVLADGAGPWADSVAVRCVEYGVVAGALLWTGLQASKGARRSRALG